MNILCPCGNDLSLVSVHCVVCDKLICPKCTISSDLNLCGVCLKEQHNFIDLKEYENKCGLCEKPSYLKNCSCCPENKILKFCKQHQNKCKVCVAEICQTSMVCTKHIQNCMFCKRQIPKLFRCAECPTAFCDSCFSFNRCFDIFVYKWHKKVICQSHSIKCGRNTGCRGFFYNIENNICSNIGCKKFCCQTCDIYKKSSFNEHYNKYYACSEHLKICLYKGCLTKDTESSMKIINWKYGKEITCGICFKKLKNDIDNLLLVLNRYRYKFPREIVEKIIL
jgi:hypothetical protein